MMNIDEQIEILEAYRDGKRIDVIHLATGTKCSFIHVRLKECHHVFNFSDHKYEIVKTGEERLIEDLEEAANPIGSAYPISDVVDIIDAIKEGKYRE